MIECQIENGIAVVKMIHGKVNAMNLEFLQEFHRQLNLIDEDSSIDHVVIAGNERVFSAGVDLKRLIAEGASYLDEFLLQLTGLFMRVFEFPKPVVAAITGHAVAGGCVLACAADYRVISNRAKIGVPELRVGVPFPVSGMEIMRWATTPQAFRKVINTGATFTGPAAVTTGFADESVESEQVIDVAIQSLKPFSIVPRDVFRLTKRQMRAPVIESIRQGREAFSDEINQLWRAEETVAAVKAYVAERLG